MSDQDSTPGPWTWNAKRTELRGAGDQVLCIDLPEFIRESDKHLIAAAPDLYTALRECVETHDACVSWAKLSDPPAISAARAVLAKAEGREAK
jgi:hypothetical protein